jgi:hypothetical protein
MLEINEVDNGVDTPIEELDDLWPTDHDIEDLETPDENVDKEEIDEPKTEEEENEESEEQESEEEDEESEPVSLEELELKVLGETKKLKDIPREELQPLLQKGSDYNRVREKLNVAQDEINEWNEVSNMFSMKPSEVIEALKNQHFTKKAEEEGRNVEDVRREYESNRKSLNDKMYERFISKYPDIKVDELPDQVVDAVKSGKDLVTVYDEYVRTNEMQSKDTEISELKEKLEQFEAKLNIKTQNKKSKKKGVIKKTSGNDTDTQTDDFLSGLSGDYS